MTREQLQRAIGLKDTKHFRSVYLLPALADGWVTMTLPDKPRSSRQRYRLTRAGESLKAKLLRRRRTS
ncbi:MAG TPA: hypothetical protein VHA82_01690 [Ramlibacter sp.]|nr:hypothetical protein [Ramlibacter sp.]HVZ42494.1 hypothetical protein [Ramlibacter sp.]